MARDGFTVDKANKPEDLYCCEYCGRELYVTELGGGNLATGLC